MTILRASRPATTVVVALALALSGGACGEDDVERNVEEGAKEAREAGKDAAGEVEKGANEAEREVEE